MEKVRWDWDKLVSFLVILAILWSAFYHYTSSIAMGLLLGIAFGVAIVARRR